MPNPSANPTPITPPRVPLIDARTGLIDRAWYMFFLSLFRAADSIDPNVAPDARALIASYDAALRNLEDQVGTQTDAEVSQLREQIAELQKQIIGLMVETRPELGTLSSVNIDWVPYLGFDTAPPWIGTAAGEFWYDSTTGSFNAKMGGNNITQQIGEELFRYGKASAAITDSPLQIVYKTGVVGASGVITFAPTIPGITEADQILGCATEPIPLNGFGRITTYGVINKINTSGAAFGEVWADNDDIWYNPLTGNPTKIKPSAPGIKLQIGTVINASGGGSGSFVVKLGASSTLGGTDSNVQFSGLADKDLIQYDSASQYWKNVPAATLPVGTATNLAGGATGSVPYQSAASTTTFLPIGTAAQVLKVNAGATAPEWVSGAALTKTDDTNVTLTFGGSPTTALLAATSITVGWSGSLAVGRGGTGMTSYAVGDLLYASGATTLSKLADVATGNVLLSGGVGVAPSYGKVGLTTHVSGVLPTANGGTNLSSFTANGVVYASSSSVLATGTGFQFDGTNVGIGAAAPAWGAAFRTLGFHNVGSVYQTNAASSMGLVQNGYSDGANWVYRNSVAAARYEVNAGQHTWLMAPTGVAGNNITWTQVMALPTTGFLSLGPNTPTAKLHLNGDISAASWGTSGIGSRFQAATFTDTSTAASGTVTAAGIYSFGQPTIAATNATVTYTDAATIYLGNAPANGTNVTITNAWSLWVGAGNVRFDGNVLLKGSTSALGYGTGSGGAVTQATSRTTGVTLNKTNGAITLVSAAGSATYQSFTVTNSTVAATDTIIVNQKSGTDKYIILVTAVAAGSFQITFATTGGTTVEQPVFNFAVIKAVTA